MDTNTRNVLLCTAGVLLGVLALVTLQPQEVVAPSSLVAPMPRETELNPSRVTLDTPSAIVAETRVYAFLASATSSVETAMQAKRAEASLSYETRDYPTLGSFLESINGVRNANGAYWMLYVNGARSSVGMSQAVVVSGDRIEWRYE